MQQHPVLCSFTYILSNAFIKWNNSKRGHSYPVHNTFSSLSYNRLMTGEVTGKVRQHWRFLFLFFFQESRGCSVLQVMDVINPAWASGLYVTQFDGMICQFQGDRTYYYHMVHVSGMRCVHKISSFRQVERKHLKYTLGYFIYIFCSKAILCRFIFILFAIWHPHSKCHTTAANTNPRSCFSWNVITLNVMCSTLVCWSKHVCEAAMRLSRNKW